MPVTRQKRLKVLAQLLIKLRQRKQFVRQKRQGLLNLEVEQLEPEPQPERKTQVSPFSLYSSERFKEIKGL